MSQNNKIPKCPNYNKICEDRENPETIYTDEFLRKKINRRQKYISKPGVGVKNVDDVRSQIQNLMNIIDCM